MNDYFGNSDVIYRYSRLDAIDDGLLIVVPEKLAWEAGFRVPIGVTSDVWAECIEWTEDDSRRQTPQDEVGRLWDLLSVLRFAAKASDGSDTVFFSIGCVPRDGKSLQPKKVELKAVLGPGDDPRPVITVMYPDQD